MYLARNRGAFLAALERPSAERAWSDLDVIVPGEARGALFGGNLALLCALAASNELAIPDGAIVMIEDVTERPYRIDRMLTSLLEGEHFAHASAIVFGEFAQCDAGPDGVTALDVCIERTRALGIPVLARAPFGHGERNEAFIVGAEARIEGATLRT